MAELQFFTESHIELVREIHKNPELKNAIVDANPADINEALGHVAAYCNIAVDGYYHQQELDDLIEELVLVLRQKRSSVAGIIT